MMALECIVQPKLNRHNFETKHISRVFLHTEDIDKSLAEILSFLQSRGKEAALEILDERESNNRDMVSEARKIWGQPNKEEQKFLRSEDASQNQGNFDPFLPPDQFNRNFSTYGNQINAVKRGENAILILSMIDEIRSQLTDSIVSPT